MSTTEIVIIVIASAYVVTVVTYNVIKRIRAKKNGTPYGCCGDCSKCRGCNNSDENNDKQE